MLHRFPLFLTGVGLLAVAFWLGFIAAAPTADAPSSEHGLPLSHSRDEPVPKSTTITMVGDIMLAREVEVAIAEHGADWPFAEIKDSWATSDLVIGNFESTIRDDYRYEGSILAFDTTPGAITGLKTAGFTHLSLANNHGDDFGAEVTDYTRQVIENLGITTFGDPVSSELHVAHADANGLPIALIGFHAFLEDPTTIIQAIKNEVAQGNFVIVMPHWGNEYQTEPSPAQVDAATMFVNAGADVIVGAHPHVIEPITEIAGAPVAYSLGNFVFDQDWSVPTTEGLMLQITVTDDAITITPIAISVVNRQATLGDFPVPGVMTFAR